MVNKLHSAKMKHFNTKNEMNTNLERNSDKHFLSRVFQSIRLNRKTHNTIEETKAQCCEIKNFNRTFESTRADANATVRMFLFSK